MKKANSLWFLNHSTAKFGAVALALVAMTGCKDDSNGNADEPIAPEVESVLSGEGISIVNDPSLLSSRVINYYTGSTSGSRAGKSTFTMPEMPAIPESAKEYDGTDKWANSVTKITKPNQEISFDGINNALYIAASNIKVKLSANGSGKVYILSPGVTITDDAINNKTIYAYAEFSTSNGDLKTQNSSKIYTDVDLKFNKVTLDNGEVCANSIRANEVEIINTPIISVVSDITATAVDGNANSGNITVNSNAVINASCIIADKKLDLKNAATLNVDSYIKATDMDILTCGCHINMLPGALVDITGKLYMPNKGNVGFDFGSTEGQAYSQVNINEFQAQVQPYNAVDPSKYVFDGMPGYFVGYAYLNVTTCINPYGNVESNIADHPRHGLVEIGTTTITANGCRPAFGSTEPTPEPDPDQVIIIGGTDSHTHPISATCIDVYGNQAFLSWHKRGVGAGSGKDDYNHDGISYWGCIEVLTMQADTLAITSYMETEPDMEGGAYDFNHVIYDAQTNSILTMGDNDKKGGIIGKIALGADRNFGKYTNDTQVMLVRSLLEGDGISGNCVVVRPDRTLLMATAGGYQTMDYTTDSLFKIIEKTKENGDSYRITPKVGPFATTAGSAKHVAINNDYAVTIEYTKRAGDIDVEYDEDNNWSKLPAKITVWPLNDYVFGTPVYTIDVDEFAPIYGKNTIAIDSDNTIYSCQGQNGVAVYKGGAEVNRFKVPGKYKGAAANGLCVKGDKLYVAYGAAGVWVLDKETLAVKGKYAKQGNNASANYVKVDDNGYVYVAYGRAGAKVMKFVNL